MKAYLALQDGTVFEGESIGAVGEVIGEIVFNTGMTGYQEVLTDPSYAGQIVTMTFPLIGNYGFNAEDAESVRPFVKGFIVREMCDTPSNWRSEEGLDAYLKRNNIIGIQGIDTRRLTKLLRDSGTMNGILTTQKDFSLDKHEQAIKAYKIIDSVYEVTCTCERNIPGSGKRVALLDLGAKENIVRSLVKRGCDVTIYPATAAAEEIIQKGFDGIMLSNGPGDPKDCTEIIKNIKKLIDANIPTFGICLGHQLTALAYGGDTGKLKYGHRGANHPVKDLAIDRTYITSQNHGYAVLAESLDKNIAEVTHINMNDGTVEGVSYKNKPVFTVQFHPEASPGPMDTAYLFDNFIKLMGGEK